MTIKFDNKIIRLQGNCGSEDVEALLAALSADDRRVDMSEVDHLHAAVLQVLLAFTPRLLGSPRDTFVRTWLIPVLNSEADDRPLKTSDSAGSTEHR
jgi:hypothetical protein